MDAILAYLRSEGAHRILTTRTLLRVLGDLPSATASRRIAKALSAGLLKPVRAGVFLNTFALPAVKNAEAAPFIRSGAIVSLQTVLGDAGVLNNYTNDVTCVMPTTGINTAGGDIDTPVGRFSFARLSPHKLFAGEVDDRLVAQLRYARATPEKALLDWLALAASPRSKMTPVPAHDIDWTLLNGRRLARLASAAEMRDEVRELKSRIDAAAHSEAYGMSL